MKEGLIKYLLGNEKRLQIAILGELGFSNRAIRRTSRCSTWYIQTVLRRAGIKRKDYRDAINRTSQYVLRKASDIAQREIESNVRKALKG